MKVRVVIDPEACQGHANCFAAAPSVFDVDDEGRARVDTECLPGEFEAAARIAARRCPESAISVELVGGGDAA